MKATARSWRSTQRGTTMLEVLIAILILSVGLFAMLGLMMNSMKLTTTSTYRAMATQHAHTMTNLINAAGSMIFDFDYYTPSKAAAEDKCFTDLAGCSQADMTNTQMKMWQDELANGLPGGAGVVCKSKSAAGTPDEWLCDGGVGDPFMVKICWDESRVGVGKGVVPGAAYYECIYTSQ
jgi:type IV pilus assembly protein PilV